MKKATPIEIYYKTYFYENKKQFNVRRYLKKYYIINIKLYKILY